jgi:hypothetical protein
MPKKGKHIIVQRKHAAFDEEQRDSTGGRQTQSQLGIIMGTTTRQS